MFRRCMIAGSLLLWFFVLPQAWPQKPAAKPKAPPPTIPDGIKKISDVEFGSAPTADKGERKLTMDIYVPEKAPTEPLPLVVWIHGGGWVQGDKNKNCSAMWLSGKGYVVASINYRLSTQAVFPAQIEDCKAAVRFLKANANQYFIDPSRVVVWGFSAGGHLAALLGETADDKDFEGKSNSVKQSTKVQAVVDFAGPADLVNFNDKIPGYEQNPPVATLLGGPAAEKKELAVKASPVTHASADDPPFLIVHGGKDTTVPIEQSQKLVDVLKKAGVSVEFHEIKGAAHNHIVGRQETNDLVEKFLEKTIKNRKSAATEGAAGGQPANEK